MPSCHCEPLGPQDPQDPKQETVFHLVLALLVHEMFKLLSFRWLGLAMYHCDRLFVSTHLRCIKLHAGVERDVRKHLAGLRRPEECPQGPP